MLRGPVGWGMCIRDRAGDIVHVVLRQAQLHEQDVREGVHGDGPAGETERKLAQAVSGFLGKQMES